MPPRPELPGPVAVVTGASRGLGAGLSATLAEHGYRLGLCARTPPTVPAGAEAVTEAVDVTDAEAVDRFASMVIDRFGRIDLWVNNAGVLEPIDFLADADAGALSNHVDVNVKGTLFGAKAFVRHVREREGTGVLVNMTSGAARTVYEGMAVYCATKAAVDMATRVIAREEAPHGLAAYAVAPGVVDTGMQVLMRETPIERLPSANRFVALKQAEAFNSPDWVARFLIDLVEGRKRPEDVVVRIPDQNEGNGGGLVLEESIVAGMSDRSRKILKPAAAVGVLATMASVWWFALKPRRKVKLDEPEKKRGRSKKEKKGS